MQSRLFWVVREPLPTRYKGSVALFVLNRVGHALEKRIRSKGLNQDCSSLTALASPFRPRKQTTPENQLSWRVAQLPDQRLLASFRESKHSLNQMRIS